MRILIPILALACLVLVGCKEKQESQEPVVTKIAPGQFHIDKLAPGESIEIPLDLEMQFDSDTVKTPWKEWSLMPDSSETISSLIAFTLAEWHWNKQGDLVLRLTTDTLWIDPSYIRNANYYQQVNDFWIIHNKWLDKTWYVKENPLHLIKAKGEGKL